MSFAFSEKEAKPQNSLTALTELNLPMVWGGFEAGWLILGSCLGFFLEGKGDGDAHAIRRTAEHSDHM